MVLATICGYTKADTILIEDISIYCTIVSNGIKLRDVTRDSYYFECRDGTAIEQKCPIETIFDKDKQDCIKIESCDGISEGWVTGPDCAFVWCDDGKALGSGYCGAGQYFNGESCAWGDCPFGTSDKMEISSICEIIPLNVFFGNTENCNTWHRCKDDGLETRNCPAVCIICII